MAISVGEQIRVNIDYINQGQKCTCGIGYRSLVSDPARTAEDFGFDWWANVKAAWRGIHPQSVDLLALQVRVASITDVATGLFGVYTIPAGEQQGTHVTGSDLMPPFVSYGIRFNIHGRNTRPGQFRPSLVTEADVQNMLLDSNALTLLQALADKLALPMPNQDAIPSDVAVPVVFGQPVDPAFPTLHFSSISGATANLYATSQVSRKQGRGT